MPGMPGMPACWQRPCLPACRTSTPAAPQHVPQKEARDATEELARANSRYQQLSEQLQAERGHIAGLEVGIGALSLPLLLCSGRLAPLMVARGLSLAATQTPRTAPGR